MIRHWLNAVVAVGLMAGGLSAANPKIATTADLAKLLREKGGRIFEQSDKDEGQRLNQEELADADRHAQRVLHLMAQNLQLGTTGRVLPPAVSEPNPADPDAWTRAEYVQHFLAQAAQFDAGKRSRRLARSSVSNAPVYVPVVTRNWSSNKPDPRRFDDDRDKSRDAKKDDVQAAAGMPQPSPAVTSAPAHPVTHATHHPGHAAPPQAHPVAPQPGYVYYGYFGPHYSHVYLGNTHMHGSLMSSGGGSQMASGGKDPHHPHHHGK